MLLSLSFLAESAFALDLDVKLTTPSGEVKSMTFHDVEASSPPTFQLQVRGATVLVTLTVTPKDDTFIVAADLTEMDRKGRSKLISTPRLVVHANEPGTVRQGTRVPITGTSPIEYLDESWELNFLVRP